MALFHIIPVSIRCTSTSWIHIQAGHISQHRPCMNDAKHATMIVITSASGRQASSFIPLLLSNSLGPLRLVVKSASSEERLRSAYPSAEVIRADLAHPDECTRVVRDAVTIYHVNPSFHPAETELGKNMVDAALAESKRSGNGFKHFVFSSVIQTQLRKLMNHDVKRYVEEYLMESGLNYTILKPTTFLDNFTPALKGLVQDAANGKHELEYKAAWSPDVLFSELAMRDLGEASLKVITEREKHYFASYDLASTMPQPWGKKIDLLAAEIGCNIKVDIQPLQQVVPGFIKTLLGCSSEEAHFVTVDTAERMILYYNRHGIVGNPAILEMILGRKATTTEDWIKEQVASAKQN